MKKKKKEITHRRSLSFRVYAWVMEKSCEKKWRERNGSNTSFHFKIKTGPKRNFRNYSGLFLDYSGNTGFTEVKLAIEILTRLWLFLYIHNGTFHLWLCAEKKIKFEHNNMCHSLLLAICQNYFPDTDWDKWKCKSDKLSDQRQAVIFYFYLLLHQLYLWTEQSGLPCGLFEWGRGGTVKLFLMRCAVEVEDSSFCHLQPGTEFSVSLPHPSPPQRPAV